MLLFKVSAINKNVTDCPTNSSITTKDGSCLVYFNTSFIQNKETIKDIIIVNIRPFNPNLLQTRKIIGKLTKEPTVPGAFGKYPI